MVSKRPWSSAPHHATFLKKGGRKTFSWPDPRRGLPRRPRHRRRGGAFAARKPGRAGGRAQVESIIIPRGTVVSQLPVHGDKNDLVLPQSPFGDSPLYEGAVLPLWGRRCPVGTVLRRPNRQVRRCHRRAMTEGVPFGRLTGTASFADAQLGSWLQPKIPAQGASALQRDFPIQSGCRLF